MTRRNKGHGRSGQNPRQNEDSLWIWGTHAVLAALANPKRRCRKLMAVSADPGIRALASAAKAQIESVDAHTLSRALPRDAIHQGLALLADPLEELDVHDVIEGAPAPRRLVLLDQVTDPHNLGAIMRSAAAFGVRGVIVQDRNSPPITGVLAKAASGAVEMVPLIRVVNIARTLEELGELGFLRLAFDDEAAEPLDRISLKRDVVVVLGAEGEGLRRLTRENCDVAVRLPTQPKMPSLNVSNAAAVALYACAVA
jgi:23S rRNA (guanosine2251-2'-O)-methyltransferase